MRIHFIGDCHGRWSSLDKAIKSAKTANVVFQVGDFGFFPRIPNHVHPFPDYPEFGSRELTGEVSGQWDTVHFIDGNHDDIVALRNGEFTHPRFTYVPRATLLEFDGVRVACMGGGVSLDCRSRTQGVDWFPEEVPTYEEFSSFFNLVDSGVDVVVTHELPNPAKKSLGLPSSYPSSVSKTLGDIFNSVRNRPRLWVGGHYHETEQGRVGGTHFQVVACCHNHRGYPASLGKSFQIKS